jgi:hypothetical protein
MLASANQAQVGFEMVKCCEIQNDLTQSQNIVLKQHKGAAKDISWSEVKFNVGEKDILTDCWGKVTIFIPNLKV